MVRTFVFLVVMLVVVGLHYCNTRGRSSVGMVKCLVLCMVSLFSCFGITSIDFAFCCWR